MATNDETPRLRSNAAIGATWRTQFIPWFISINIVQGFYLNISESLKKKFEQLKCLHSR